MRLGPALLAVAGMIGFAVVIVAAGARIDPQTATAPATEIATPDAPEPGPSREFDGAGVGTSRRPAEDRSEGGRIAALDLGEGRLERVEPRPPLSELSLALPPKQGVAEPTLLYRAIAVAAGRIEAHGHVVELPGIRIVEPDRVCRDADGRIWACGMVARTAFRNWLRGRAVECTVAEPPSRETVTSACRLGKKDVGEWLVENGYAEASAGGPYGEAEDTARAERRGIHASAPPA